MRKKKSHLDKVAVVGPWGPGMRSNPVALEAIRLYFVEGKNFEEVHEMLDWGHWVTLGLVEEFLILGEEIEDWMEEVVMESVKAELDAVEDEGWVNPEARRFALESFKCLLKDMRRLPSLPPARAYDHRGH